VATGRNRWQMGRRRKRLKQAKTVAVGCDQLPKSFHGKEGVDGSSPSEGFAKALQKAPSLSTLPLQIVAIVQKWNRFGTAATGRPAGLVPRATARRPPRRVRTASAQAAMRPPRLD
jgi:hypothetical protein